MGLGGGYLVYLPDGASCLGISGQLQVFHHRPFDLHNPQSQEFSRSNLALSSKLRSYAWKEAMGAVRVIVKVTTQCRASWLAEEVFEIWDTRDAAVLMDVGPKRCSKEFKLQMWSCFCFCFCWSVEVSRKPPRVRELSPRFVLLFGFR